MLFSYKKLGSHCKINLGKVSLVSLCFLHSNLRILPSGLRREEPPVEFCLVGYGPGLITMCSALMQSLIFQHLASICILGGKEQHYTLGNFILSNPMRMPALAVMAIAVSVEILSLRGLESMPFVSHVLYRQTNIHIHSDISQRFTDCK